MNLKINNFAKIGEAVIDVDGLSVIAGPNGSGKSTVGKLFYSVISAIYHTKTDYEREKNKRLRNVLEHNEDLSLDNFFSTQKRTESREIASKILSGGILAYEGKLSEQSAYKIEKVLSVTEDDFFNACVGKMFKYEFGFQLLNVHNPERSQLDFSDACGKVHIDIINNTKIESKAVYGAKTPVKEAFYIDTPYIMDETGFGLYHRRELKRRLFGEQENLAQKIFGRLFMEIGGGETVNISNVSAGFKTVLMLKRMYGKGLLANGNLLILDEPEIHLHPDLQITLAQILVTLVKAGKIKVLINTHSPYFLEAIEVFAEKNEIESLCRFYLTTDEGESSKITETTGNVEQIYKLLAMPFEKLEKLRNDDNDV